MGERLRATGTPEKDVEPLAELLAEDLAEWPEDAWLAFDDYQFACESPFAEEFVERVLALCPLKLFLTSRKRPSWATSRRLLYGDIYEIGRSLLAMSQEEAEQVLADRRGSEARGLIALADGWPAVIGLAALTEEIELPDEGLPEALYDYFAEELYQAAEPEVRWSLSQLSLSSSVAPAVAESVLGSSEAERALVDGHRLGFLVPSEHGVFEIHPLLRTFLEEKFRELAGERAPAIVELVVQTHLAPGGVGRRVLDRRALLRRGAARPGSWRPRCRRCCSRRGCQRSRAGSSAPSEHEADAPVFDLAEGELTFRAGDMTRSEALGLQAARRFDQGHPLVSRSYALAGASAHLACEDEVALEYYGQAHETAQAGIDIRQSLWGQFVAYVALERDAARALEELEAHSTDSVDDLLRLANGRIMLGALTRRTSAKHSRMHVAWRRSPTAFEIRSSIRPSSTPTPALLSFPVSTPLRSTWPRMKHVKRSTTSSTSFFRMRACIRAAALWGLRRFRQCVICLDESQRLNVAEDGLLLMNIGAIRAKLQLSLGSPGKALASLAQYDNDQATVGMEAEYKAWWSLALACAE